MPRSGSPTSHDGTAREDLIRFMETVASKTPMMDGDRTEPRDRAAVLLLVRRRRHPLHHARCICRLQPQVVMANDCIGEEVEKLAAALPEGGVLLLENVRFYKEEEKNDPEFAKKLASVAGLYVNDAFGTAHRAHASTEGVTKFLRPSVAGFLMQKLAPVQRLVDPCVANYHVVR